MKILEPQTQSRSPRWRIPTVRVWNQTLLVAVLLVPNAAVVGCAPGAGYVCDSDTENCDIEQTSQPVVYGTDNRKEYSDPGVSNAERKLADATALLVSEAKGQMTCDAASCFVRQRAVKGLGLCAGQKFGPSATLPEGQKAAGAGFGTAFLVAPNLLATASHNLEVASCSDLKVVFGYKADSYGDAPLMVPAKDVYSCSAVVLNDPANDRAVIRLDRNVSGRAWLPIRRKGTVPSSAPLLLVGHPSGLPIKVSRGGAVKVNNVGKEVFDASVDAFGGNSGSPVFDAQTGLVEGILVAGQEDYVLRKPAGDPDGCYEVNSCSEATGCAGYFEEIGRVSR